MGRSRNEQSDTSSDVKDDGLPTIELSRATGRLFESEMARVEARAAVEQWCEKYRDRSVPYPLETERETNDELERNVVAAAIHDAACKSDTPVGPAFPHNWLDCETHRKFKRYWILIGLVEDAMNRPRGEDSTSDQLQGFYQAVVSMYSQYSLEIEKLSEPSTTSPNSDSTFLPARWFDKQTKGGLNPALLRMAFKRESIRGEKRNNRLHYELKSVLHAYPEYEAMLCDPNENERKRTNANT